jgi:hypothetical protein
MELNLHHFVCLTARYLMNHIDKFLFSLLGQFGSANQTREWPRVVACDWLYECALWDGVAVQNKQNLAPSARVCSVQVNTVLSFF